MGTAERRGIGAAPHRHGLVAGIIAPVGAPGCTGRELSWGSGHAHTRQGSRRGHGSVGAAATAPCPRPNRQAVLPPPGRRLRFPFRRGTRGAGRGLRNPVQFRFILTVDNASALRTDRGRATGVPDGIPGPLRWRSPSCPRQPRRAASMAAMSIFVIDIIASKARFASPPPAASASVSARGVICQERPQRSLHQPH